MIFRSDDIIIASICVYTGSNELVFFVAFGLRKIYMPLLFMLFFFFTSKEILMFDLHAISTKLKFCNIFVDRFMYIIVYFSDVPVYYII